MNIQRITCSALFIFGLSTASTLVVAQERGWDSTYSFANGETFTSFDECAEVLGSATCKSAVMSTKKQQQQQQQQQ